jgi:hypothetical protein
MFLADCDSSFDEVGLISLVNFSSFLSDGSIISVDYKVVYYFLDGDLA